jgi:hypothetical protein
MPRMRLENKGWNIMLAWSLWVLLFLVLAEYLNYRSKKGNFFIEILLIHKYISEFLIKSEFKANSI